MNKLERIIDGLQLLDADIVVMSELNPLAHAQTIANRLSASGACYEAVAVDQPLASQEIGFLVQCDVDASSGGLVIGSDLGKRGYRNGAVISAKSGNFDLILIGLHLKAGRDSSDRAFRSEQLRIISAYLQGALIGGEKDVLILGDYNMIPGPDDENFDMLNADGSVRCMSSESLADGFSHIGSQGPGELLDGFCATNVDTSEYVENSIEIVQLHDLMGLTLAQYRARVTDHLPIVAEFNTDLDHD